jgi:prophage regulatory protein
MQEDSEPDIIVRLPAVEQFTGKKRSQLYDDIRNNLFPRPLKITEGGHAVGWLRRELIAWQRERIAARDKAMADAKAKSTKKAVRR